MCTHSDEQLEAINFYVHTPNDPPMTRDSISRRQMVTLTGAAVGTALVAGCNDDNGDNGDDNGDDGDDADVSDWEGVDEIRLEGHSSGWEGLEPSMIAGETNPTLILFEGDSYSITWENGDGATHNIEIVDDGDNVVGDYSTENTNDDEQTLEIDEVTSDFHEYVCRPHAGPMRGSIQVE